MKGSVVFTPTPRKLVVLDSEMVKCYERTAGYGLELEFVSDCSMFEFQCNVPTP